MKKHIGIYIALLVLVIQFFALPYAGMTWDEPSVFFIGRANLNFWRTGNREYLNDLHNKELFRGNPMAYMYGAHYYPPFSFTLASGLSYVLAENLKLLPVIDAHHLGGLLLASAGVAALYSLLLLCGFSVLSAVLTTVLYALYPTIWGQMRNDVKDIPLMSMIVIAVYFFVRFMKSWKERGEMRRIILAVVSAVCIGLAASIKPTAFVMLPIIAVWFLFALQESSSFYKSLKPVRRMFLLWPFLAFVAVGAFILSWPWIWDDPGNKLTAAWEFFKKVGYHMPVPYFGDMWRAGISVPPEYPLGILLVQTPVELTILAMIGMVVAIRRMMKNDDPYPMLFVFWFWLGLVRFFIDGTIIYAKIRQFIDVLPAFLALAGLGLMGIATVIHSHIDTLFKRHRMKNIRRDSVVILLGLGVVAHLVWISVSFFPYEPSYFNILVGGAKTIADKGSFDVEYWGSGVREAMEFVNKQEGKPFGVYACLMRHLAINYAAPGVTVTQVGEPYRYMIIPNSPSWFGPGLTFARDIYKQPAYVIQREGAPLLYVYEMTAPLIWRCGNESPLVDEDWKF